jgi:hypothetical protein
VDSGTTAHMTPFVSDLDKGSFEPSNTSIRVANNHRASAIGKGTVTLTLHNYIDDTTLYLQLTNVLVVPDLHKRLVSTDELNDYRHGVWLEPMYSDYIYVKKWRTRSVALRL